MEEYENFIHNKYGWVFYSVEPGEKAMVFNLYTEPEYRRKGHAKKLLQYVIDEIRRTGYQGEIEIEATPRESSIEYERLVSFYKMMGLKIRLTSG